MKDSKKTNKAPEEAISETNGDEHYLIPDEPSWAEEAKEEMEEFIESQGIHIRQ